MLALITRATSEKTKCSEEFTIVMDDGRIKWHTTTIHPMLDEHGDVIGLYGILQNISQKKLRRK